MRESFRRTFGSSPSLQSSPVRSSIRDASFIEGERLSFSNAVRPRVSVAEVLYDSAGGFIMHRLCFAQGI